MHKLLLAKKAKILLKDNAALFLLLVGWFLCGFLVYYFILRVSFVDSLKASLFFRQAGDDFSVAYQTWSQGIIFGAVFTFLFQNIIEKFNPERGCRMMANEMHDHVVVVGYSHLGQRLVTYLRQQKIPYCLIEKNKEAVDELLREGEPVVIDNAKEIDALQDANVDSAKVVVVASNNLETALIVTKRARDLNKKARIIARCFQDEFAEVIESLGADDVISSSKHAFSEIEDKLKV